MRTPNDTPIPDGYKRCCRGDKCAHPAGPILLVSEFSKDRSQKDGLCIRCKACDKVAKKTPGYRAYNIARQQTPEYKARAKEYAHSEKWKARAPGYYKTYRESHVTTQGQKYREYQRNYRKSPAGKLSKYITHQKRRAMRLALPCTFTSQDWVKCLKYFDNRCAVCGREASYSNDLFGSYILSVDHWVPLTSPACPGTVPTNIVPLCHGEDGCNNSKNDRDAHEWLLSRYDPQTALRIERRIIRYFKWVKDQSDGSS